MTEPAESLEAALLLAKEATNGWACYAKRKIEHDEIARLHRDIAALSQAPEQKDRLRELAMERASELHWQPNHEPAPGHSRPLKECTHPDCVLVRTAGVSQTPPQAPKEKP